MKDVTVDLENIIIGLLVLEAIATDFSRFMLRCQVPTCLAIAGPAINTVRHTGFRGSTAVILAFGSLDKVCTRAAIHLADTEKN